MSALLCIADGCRGMESGTVTLSAAVAAELQAEVSRKQVTGIKVERMRNGGVIIKATDLCKVVFDTVGPAAPAAEDSPDDIVEEAELDPTVPVPTEELKTKKKSK